MFEPVRRRSQNRLSTSPTPEDLRRRLAELEGEERELRRELRTLNAEHAGLLNLLEVIRYLIRELTEKQLEASTDTES